MVFHCSLSDSKSPHVSRTRLSVLTVLSNAVIWIVSTRQPTSKSSRPFNNPLVTVPILLSGFSYQRKLLVSIRSLSDYKSSSVLQDSYQYSGRSSKCLSLDSLYFCAYCSPVTLRILWVLSQLHQSQFVSRSPLWSFVFLKFSNKFRMLISY